MKNPQKFKKELPKLKEILVKYPKLKVAEDKFQSFAKEFMRNLSKKSKRAISDDEMSDEDTQDDLEEDSEEEVNLDSSESLEDQSSNFVRALLQLLEEFDIMETA